MKNSFKCFCLASIALVCLMTSCASTNNSSNLESFYIEKVETACGEIKVSSEPVKEVMLILLRLAEMPEAVFPYYGNSDFNVAVETWFTKYKNHNSVKVIKNMMKDYSYDDFISITNIINDEMTGFTCEVKSYPYYVNSNWNKKNAEKVLTAMNVFARETKFDKFYLLNRASYITMQTGVQNALEDGTIQKFLSEAYLSGKDAKIKIHISELLCGNVMYYGTGTETEYVQCLSPYYSKEYYYILLSNLTKVIVNPMLSSIDESKFKIIEDNINIIRQKNGMEQLKGDEIKYFVLNDFIGLGNLIYCRDNDKKDDYETLLSQYKQNFGQIFMDDIVSAWDAYFADEVEKRDIRDFLKNEGIEADITLYKSIVERIQ